MSDSEMMTPSSAADSGANSPSTAPTLVRGATTSTIKRRSSGRTTRQVIITDMQDDQVMEQDDDDDDDDVQVLIPSTDLQHLGPLSHSARSSRDYAPVKGSRKSVAHAVMTADSIKAEDSDGDSEHVTPSRPTRRSLPRRRSSQAKGNARIVQIESESEDDDDFAMVQDNDDDDNNDDDEDAGGDMEQAYDVETATRLAKALQNGGSKKGKARYVDAEALGKNVASKLGRARNGSTSKQDQSFELVVAKSNKVTAKTKSATPVTENKRQLTRTNSTRSKRGVTSASIARKSKMIVDSSASSDGSDDASAFSPDSDEDEDEGMLTDDSLLRDLAGSEAEEGSDDDLPDAGGDDGIKRNEKSYKKQVKTAEEIAEKLSRPKIKPRKGHVFSKKEKKMMSQLSRYEKADAYLMANHPELVDCWPKLEAVPRTKVERAEQPAGLTQKLLPFQLEGLNWMVKQEQSIFGGGFLCDEMGMGKTIQTIALILSDFNTADRKRTLVLAPTVAIIQWSHEIAKFTEGMKVLVYHGAGRIKTVKEMEQYDIVLTSYAVMESTFRREQKGFMRKGNLMKEDSIVHKVNWHRVILDEAHNIKDRASNTAKGAFALKAKYRWCLSGTPLQNRVGELYSLIRFVGVSPHAYYFCKQCDCKSLHWLCNKGPCTECRHSGMQHVCWWNTEILKPIQYGGMHEGQGAKAFRKLSILLERLMLRRTKVERADDLGLPPRVVNVRRDYFTEEEEELYQSLFKDVKRKFNTYANEGTVLNNYSNIFTLITRMRQMADHPDLVLKSRTAMPVQHADSDKPEEILTCRICLDEAEDAVKTQCRHIFCRECVRQYIETATVHKPLCPVCNIPITIDLDQAAIEQDTTGRQGILSRLDPTKTRTSTKIEALLEELSKTRTEDHTLKTLIFSQFTTMLDLVARRLQLGGYKFVRIAGTMTPLARDNTIKAFTEDPECTVFLISLKAGGVALNLVEASRVILLDPWWNPAVELQAMDRTHRIGQHRPITITRLVIENSIESRILELQRKKENLAASALGDDTTAAGRLTPEDLRFLFSLS
ncbi:BQ5605_C008g04976 [Microbotryum silenes-dioicae]|uniref:BQ5605_C008g04976 protein n=1 Tax=Microbotryum silenes-dioicae TaxID=796604 RepID=A0A2X0MBN3_9BASI|nr:BQ5605_C008g04976 [Microbotryum silenes-dioicae]